MSGSTDTFSSLYKVQRRYETKKVEKDRLFPRLRTDGIAGQIKSPGVSGVVLALVVYSLFTLTQMAPIYLH